MARNRYLESIYNINGFSRSVRKANVRAAFGAGSARVGRFFGYIGEDAEGIIGGITDAEPTKRHSYNAAARIYRRSPAAVFGGFVVLILMVAIVNWIWVSTGHSSALLKSYYVDANGNPADYTAWNGQTFKLYYWDVFGWLGSMGGTFKNLGDSFIKTFDDFSISLDGDFVTGFLNVIILILNLAWSLVKLVILFPLSIVAAIFQAFMSSWITSDGWLTQAVTWHIPYLSGIDWSGIFSAPIGAAP